MMPDLFDYSSHERLKRAALVSDCGKYRYWLRRTWTHTDNKVVCFIMLNPSVADALIDDPTIRKCMAFAKAWGYSTLDVRNLFAWRATNPKELPKVADPVGPAGDLELKVCASADLIVCAWGQHGGLRGRDKQVLALLKGRDLYCLKLTKDGRPWHPLYVKGDTQPMLFREALTPTRGGLPRERED